MNPLLLVAGSLAAMAAVWAGNRYGGTVPAPLPAAAPPASAPTGADPAASTTTTLLEQLLRMGTQPINYNVPPLPAITPPPIVTDPPGPGANFTPIPGPIMTDPPGPFTLGGTGPGGVITNGTPPIIPVTIGGPGPGGVIPPTPAPQGATRPLVTSLPGFGNVSIVPMRPLPVNVKTSLLPTN